jgi:hypothetical protein
MELYHLFSLATQSAAEGPFDPPSIAIVHLYFSDAYVYPHHPKRHHRSLCRNRDSVRDGAGFQRQRERRITITLH